jgi:hypothetical protein
MAAAAGSKGTGQPDPGSNTYCLHRFSFETLLLGTELAIAAQCRQIDFLGFVQHAVKALAADA